MTTILIALRDWMLVNLVLLAAAFAWAVITSAYEHAKQQQQQPQQQPTPVIDLAAARWTARKARAIRAANEESV